MPILNLGLHFDYKSKAGERAMEKERKRLEKLAAKKAKREAKREAEELSRVRAFNRSKCSIKRKIGNKKL